MSVPEGVLDQPLPGIHPTLGLWPAARWYAAAGVPVFPGFPSGKLPNADQVGSGWRTTEIATFDVAQVDLWWGADPFSNILVPMGFGQATSGWPALDLDYRNGLQPATRLAERCAELGVEVPQGLRGRSPAGEHIHALLPAGVRRFPKRPDYIPGAVDVASSGGYLAMPPSRIYVPGDTTGVPDSAKATAAREGATWREYRWVRPGTPNPTDVYPDGPFAEMVADVPVPELETDEEWHPTIREWRDALSATEWPRELVADVLTRPTAPKASGGRTAPYGITERGLYRWPEGVPVDEWIEHGLPADLNHEACVKQMSNCLAGRGWTEDEITDALVYVTDPAVTPLKRPEAWGRTLLRRKAHESVAWVHASREAEAVENAKRTRTWTP